MKCIALLCCFVVAVSAESGQNVVDTARRMGIYSYLFALQETGNLDLVSNSQNITVFIPTNDAFKRVGAETINFWRNNPAYYSELMKFHVVKGERSKQDLVDEDLLDTFAAKGMARFVNYTGYSKDAQLFDTSEIKQYDIHASNGVIHLINQVVTRIPNQSLTEILQSRTDLTNITAAVKLIQNISDTLNGVNPVTFLAPTDEAIGKLQKGVWANITRDPVQLTEILQHHLLWEGSWFSRGFVDGYEVKTLDKNRTVLVGMRDNELFFNKARATTVDLAATNGVLYVIDTILFPDAYKTLQTE